MLPQRPEPDLEAAKIDQMMAAFNANAWMAANPASSQPSIFVIQAMPD